MTLSHNSDLNEILPVIYVFADDVTKEMVRSIEYALDRPNKGHPPRKKGNLSVAEIITLAIFRFFTGHRNWKDFYRHIKTYHHKDFPNLPAYQNFVAAMNRASGGAMLLQQLFMQFFNAITSKEDPKFADSSKLEVCHIKREFTHKVAKGLAKKSKSTMGWFYGFKIHAVCNELMQILEFRITPGNVDDRVGLEMMWENLFGMIVADAGYLGRNWQEKACRLDKILLAGVRSNMNKIMTETQYQLLKLRGRIETVFSVLKVRFGLVSTLPRSVEGLFAHYFWSIAAYQFKKLIEFFDSTRLTDPMALLKR
jgi:hypothetical protein